MKSFLCICAILFSATVAAEGWTSTSRVSSVEIIRDQGFEVKGAFGNPSACQRGDTIFVSINHPQYAELFSTAMAAFSNGKRLKMYSHQCVSYGWHRGNYNELTAAGAMFMRH